MRSRFFKERIWEGGVIDTGKKSFLVVKASNDHCVECGIVCACKTDQQLLLVFKTKTTQVDIKQRGINDKPAKASKKRNT
jgi:hypothetical protein